MENARRFVSLVWHERQKSVEDRRTRLEAQTPTQVEVPEDLLAWIVTLRVSPPSSYDDKPTHYQRRQDT